MRIKILFSVILISIILPAFVIGQGNVDLPNPGLTPDSPFYFFDTIGKKLNLFFTFSPEKKAEKAIQFAEERLAEAKVMGEKNKTKALASANQAYQEYLNLANQKTKEAKEEGKNVEELAILITEKTLQHQEVLIEVFEKVPEEAKAAIETAIRASRKGSEEAVQAVTGAKKDELIQRIEETRTRVEERITVLEKKIQTLEEKLEQKVAESEAEVERLKKEAETAKGEAGKARLIAEAEKAKAEAEKARAEAGTAKAEAERLRREAEEAKKTITEEKLTPLSLANVSPYQILNNIDNYLTISGSGIQKGAEVIIGGIGFGAGNVIDNKTITLKIPSGVLTPNVYSVQVVNPDGKAEILYNVLTIVKPQPPASSAPTELTPEEIASKISPAVVQIRNDKGTGCPCTGSGMIIDLSGHVLTNWHVIDGDPAVDINLNGQMYYNSPVIGWNEIYDLAIVKISGNNFNYVVLGDSNVLSYNEKVFAFGFPLTDFPATEPTYLRGDITNKNVIKYRANTEVPTIQISASIQHGSSGGPLVNNNGEVIGVNTWCNPDAMVSGVCFPGYGLAVKINTAKSILPDLKAGAKVSLPAPAPEPEPEPTPTDTIPPSISNVQISNTAPSTATILYSITWTTNEPSTSQVWYGPTESLGNLTSLNSSLVLSHTVTLYGLSPEIMYYLKVISKDASGNQTVSSIQSFSTSAITPGTLSITVASSPGDQSVVSGTTNVPIFGLVMTAGSVENVRVLYLKLTRSSSGIGVDSDFYNIALWDGSTRITAKKNLNNGYIVFSASDFLNASGIDIARGGQRTITVKADISSTAPVSNLNSLGIISANDITFTGLDSNQTPSPALSGGPGNCAGVNISCSSPSDAYEVVITRPMPTIAAASLPSTVFSAGEKTFYRWTMTAPNQSAIGWKKVIFDVSGSITDGVFWDIYTIGLGGGVSTDGIYMGTSTNPTDGVAKQLISATTMKVYNVATGVEVMGNKSVQNFIDGGARISFISDTEQTVAAGTTNTYELRGSILYGGKAGDSLSAKIAKKSTGTITDTYANIAGTDATLVWSDRSVTGHSETTADWFNDYQVSGLPSATLSLSK